MIITIIIFRPTYKDTNNFLRRSHLNPFKFIRKCPWSHDSLVDDIHTAANENEMEKLLFLNLSSALGLLIGRFEQITRNFSDTYSSSFKKICND